MHKTVLVLGAAGGVGGETARALVRHGWDVRGLVRSPRPGLDPAVHWIEGDAMDRRAVLDAARGVAAIVHAVNPPGYRDWDKLVLPMIDDSIAAAAVNDARLVLPGTIYNYDPATTPVAQPDMAQTAQTRKGRIRVAMEQRIADSGVRALILRAGDYYGPRAANNWLSQGLVTPGKPVRTIQYPGARGVGHSWAYLPDVAETFARLLDRDAEMPRLARYHFAGFWDADGTAFVDAIRAVVGVATKVRPMPWALLPFLAPFNRTLHELIEMRPFWQNPVRLDDSTLRAFLGEVPQTPVRQSVRASLDGIGCLMPLAA
ncbi:NAD-dependent epimerase/dehydratase family protein [Sphingomonas sp. CJ20]